MPVWAVCEVECAGTATIPVSRAVGYRRVSLPHQFPLSRRSTSALDRAVSRSHTHSQRAEHLLVLLQAEASRGGGVLDGVGVRGRIALHISRELASPSLPPLPTSAHNKKGGFKLPSTRYSPSSPRPSKPSYPSTTSPPTSSPSDAPPPPRPLLAHLPATPPTSLEPLLPIDSNPLKRGKRPMSMWRQNSIAGRKGQARWLC